MTRGQPDGFADRIGASPTPRARNAMIEIDYICDKLTQLAGRDAGLQATAIR